MTDDTIPTGPRDDDRTNPLGPFDASAPGESIGGMVGPYRLLRRVALKVIKQGMDTRAVVVRFEAERQALAMMDHPCIARVFDAGATDRGRPYFVMEYVEGESITDYCNRRRLDTTARLELFVRVCEGVQHAHQKAVIHRDLKPSNILVAEVDGRPVPKIIDFGVAKATTQRLTDVAMITEQGQLIGTPEYMSPEQASLTDDDIDTRTDVYALGVVLYELLAGALPFDSTELRRAGYEAIRKIIREQEPPRPSTRVSSLGDLSTVVAADRGCAPKRLRSELRGDLDWITMKALEKDRDRRYETANGLAADVRRHLRNEPVTAGPPSVGYRATKFVRRNRTGVVIVAVSVLALATFAVTSTLQAGVIARERDRAEAEAAKAAAMNDFLAQTLASADPWAGGDRDATVVQALDAAVEQIGSVFAGQPEVEASMRGVLGQTYLGLGKLEPAREQIERAVAMRLELGEDGALDLGHLRVAEAKLRQEEAAYDAGVTSAADAARIFRGDRRATAGDLLNAYQNETRNLLFSQRYAEAESLLVLAEELAPRVEGDRRILTAEILSQRADLYRERDGDAAAADSLSRLAYELGKSIDPDHAVLPIYLNNAAQYRSEGGDLEGALADFDAALVLNEKIYGTDHPQYATCLENRGGVLYRLGRPDETFAALEQVRDIRRRNLGPGHIDVVRTGLNMGAVASLAGDHGEAVTIFRELKPVLVADRGRDHPDYMSVLRNEGLALNALGRREEALEVFTEGLEIGERVLGEQHPTTAQLRNDRGMTLRRLGRHAEAERELTRAYEAFRAELGADHRSTRVVAGNLVDLYEETGDVGKAARYREAAGQ